MAVHKCAEYTQFKEWPSAAACVCRLGLMKGLRACSFHVNLAWKMLCWCLHVLQGLKQCGRGGLTAPHGSYDYQVGEQQRCSDGLEGCRFLHSSCRQSANGCGMPEQQSKQSNLQQQASPLESDWWAAGREEATGTLVAGSEISASSIAHCNVRADLASLKMPTLSMHKPAAGGVGVFFRCADKTCRCRQADWLHTSRWLKQRAAAHCPK